MDTFNYQHILSKLEIEGNFLNLIENIHEKPIADILLNGEKLEIFLLKIGKRYHSFQILDVLANAANKT